MIDLKSARDKADELVEGKVPKASTLRGWAMNGLISGRSGYGTKGAGTVGLYPNYLVLEIITVINLKQDYNLKEIAEIRKNVKEELEKQDETFDDLVHHGSKTGTKIEDANLKTLFNKNIDDLIMFKMMRKYIHTLWKARNQYRSNEVMATDEKIL